MLSPPRAAGRGPRPDAGDAEGRLERLLQHLEQAGTAVRRGGGPSLPEDRHPTGLPEIDGLIGGGFPRGRVSEIAGPASCGRTSLAHALLARTTAAGELACVVDRANAFDPLSARQGGVDLARVLWVRPPGVTEALRCAEHVLRAGGFALVLLDLASAHEAPRISGTIWPRVRKVVAGADAALVTLCRERLVGTFADLALELGEARAHFDEGPSWLSNLDGRVLLVRNRLGPDGSSVAVRWWSRHDPASPVTRRPGRERAA
ncbi:MAG: hypothetical protein QF410_12470 [Planctomycetota bacterium]|jgi:hypothetical protein|nr:hypothetical protein [Planctomycetota bacterium]